MHKVQAKGILSAQNGMNIYRGCQHGCIYCDARSTCYQMKHAFEDIEVKENAPLLLEQCVRVKTKGIITFGMGVTLRQGDREYFYSKLDRHFPGMKQRYIHAFGNNYEVPSPNESELMEILRRTCKEHGIWCDAKKCFAYLHEFEEQDVGRLDF